MKKYIGIMIMMLVVLIAAPTVSALGTGEVEIDKDPLVPGEATDLWIEIINKGDEIENIHLRLQYHSEDMLTAPPAMGTIGITSGSVNIKQMDTGDRQKVHFRIFVDDNADEGLYDLELVARYEREGEGIAGLYNTTIIEGDTGLVSGGFQTISIISIKVTELNDYLSVTTSDNVFSPGSDGAVTLTLKNLGKGVAEGVTVEVNPIPEDSENGGSSSLIPPELNDMLGGLSDMTALLGGGGSGSASSPSNVPIFSVVGSGTRLYMGDIGRSESSSITFTLAVDESAERGTYNLPITIKYDNGRTETTELIGIRVLSKANLVVPETKTDPREVTPGKSATYLVTVENIGKNDAKSVKVNIENDFVTGDMTDYIGTIEAGDEGTAIFDLDLSSDVPKGKLELPVVATITYQDDLGVHTFTEGSEIKLKDNDESEESGTSASFTQIGMVLAILCVVSFVLYKRFPRGNN